MIEHLHTYATILSLALTPTAILLSLIVVVLWWSSAHHALFNQDKKDVHWFVIGVTISFFGSILDNAYWGITWLAEYMGHPSWETLFHYGVLANVPFRQICTVLAALCHIRAASITDSKKLKFAITIVWLLVPVSVFFLLGLQK